MAYASLALLKSYLKIDAGDTVEDALLEHCLRAAQTSIDHFCGQTFEAPTDSERFFDPTRHVYGRELMLDAPLCAITSITNGDGQVISSDKYLTVPRGQTPWHTIVLKSDANVVWAYRGTPEEAISIVGRWAYSITPPDDIVQATLRMALYIYRQRDNAIDLDRAVLTANATVLPADLPRDIKTLLFQGGYRRTLISS